MTIEFAAYLRTSTEESQSPEDSRRWQLSLAQQLIGPRQGQVVAVYHDIDVSRSLPWPRRPEASRLLADVADPGRGWKHLVIGEPQRAFSGGQFQLVFPVLCHYGVELWVPEVGGPVDPDSEAHDLVMSLFGGLSKAERRRVQHRTRASMLALAAGGRWLGGRPNFGYRLVDTGLPHPNRSKASAGAQLRTLEPDPETAPVVRRIFELYDAGVGLRSIAQRLEAEGIPSPGEIGPVRHPRSAGVWGGSAVRTILTNPRYLGRQVAGRQRRYDELLDARDPALGTVSRQRRQSPDSWAWSEQPSWPALIPADLFERVNKRITNTVGTRTRTPRSRPGQYVLAGAIRCGHCGKAMFGNTAKNKPYYRCAATRPDYAAPSVPGHPPTYMVREERILAAVDGWLNTLTDPDHIDATVAAILAADRSAEAEPNEVVRARRRRQRLALELDRMLAAIRAGMDPVLAASQTRKIQAEIADAHSTIEGWERSQINAVPLDEDEVRDALTNAGGLVVMLAEADRW
ncbi:MAG TPA: recombinase family protein [Egibacteraceae bacterium]|nr:recombinase family protein [Egibacteraceae bacterium]